MRRIWIALVAICCMNSVLLSGCPIGPAFDDNPHETGGHGGGNGNGGGNGGGM
jgi:hypothetical protein